jgi:hypothetical protein
VVNTIFSPGVRIPSMYVMPLGDSRTV